jgi:hypothetical protein
LGYKIPEVKTDTGIRLLEIAGEANFTDNSKFMDAYTKNYTGSLGANIRKDRTIPKVEYRGDV